MNEKLLKSIRQRDAEGIQEALKNGADPNAKSSRQRTALTLLCDNYEQHDQLELMKILIDAGADLNSQEDGKDRPLHYACMYGPAASALLLLNKGADPNQKGSYGRTPLHYTAVKFPRVVEALINLGVNVNAENDGKTTPLFEAISSTEMPSENIVLLLDAKAMIFSRDKEYILDKASFYGTLQSGETLLNQGLSPLQQDRWGKTAFYSAFHSHIEPYLKVKAMVRATNGIDDDILENILAYVCKQDDLPLRWTPFTGHEIEFS